jgi:sulfofructose kinase
MMLDIVGLGLATLDVLVRLDEMPTWEKGSALREVLFDGGGMVGTALVAAARLGARTGYMGTCGNDEIAAMKMSYLTRYGVDASQVAIRSNPESQVVVVYVHSQTGERVFSANHQFRVSLQPEELDRDYIISAAYLLLDSFHYEAALQAAQWMHAAGKPVVLDAGKTSGAVDPHMAALVALTDVLICGSGFGPAFTRKSDLKEAGLALLSAGPRLVIQTEGANGCFTTTSTEHFHTPAYPVEVVDTTGAGDVFHGAYLYGLLQGWDIRYIARFASAVAALKCTHMGGRAGIPTRAETESFMHGQTNATGLGS